MYLFSILESLKCAKKMSGARNWNAKAMLTASPTINGSKSVYV